MMGMVSASFLKSSKFRIIWSVWILVLGVTLFVFHTFEYVSSFSEYLNAFLVFDMPSSWCPTFLTLYGATGLFGDRLKVVNRFAGLVLLPMGIYTTYTYTVMPSIDPLGVQIYAQTIHVSEFLTGLHTVWLIVKR